MSHFAPPDQVVTTPTTIDSYGGQLLAQLRAITDEILRLDSEKIAVTKLLLTHVSREFTINGDPTVVREFAELFKDAHGPGFQKEWSSQGLPHYNTVTRASKLYRHDANDGEGRWVGPWPLADGACVPPPKTPVVYQLLAGDEVVYIGSTVNMASRLAQHAKDKGFDNWRAAKCESERACRDLETALIDAYRPPFNRMIPTPKVTLIPRGDA